MLVRLAMIAAISLCIAACMDRSPLTPRADLKVVDAASLPAPTQADLTIPGRPYALGPGDRITVEVLGLPDLTREVQLDSNGDFSLPLAGEIHASGKSAAEVANLVKTNLMLGYVRDPQVTVNVEEAVSQIVTVSGQVNTPGTFPVTGPTTLLRTIARAKGLSELARAEHVVVLRRVGGQDMAALYDLRAISQGYYADPQIYANDVVLVGESQSRRFFRDLIQGSSLITTPIIAALQVL